MRAPVIPVDQARSVGGGEAGEQGVGDLERGPGGELALGPHDVAKRGAGDVLHDEVGRVPVHTLVIHGDHVGVGEFGCGDGLGLESVDERGILRQVRVEDLDRHSSAQLGVRCEVDGGHASARYTFLDGVTAIEECPDHRVCAVGFCHAFDPRAGEAVGP
jgi:hypothetical protein